MENSNNKDKWKDISTPPDIPEGKYGISVIGCWDCCEDEKNIVSELNYNRNGEFCQLMYGPMGTKWYKVDVKKWMPMPKP